MGGRIAKIACVSLCFVSCTQVTVKRITDESNSEGLRYYLPQPFILVTPQEDGSLTAEVVNMADHGQVYGVSARSFMATHELSVKLDRGMLSEVALTANDTDIGLAAASAAGEIEKAKLDAEADAAKTARDEAKKKRDANDQDLKTKRQEISKEIDDLKDKLVAARLKRNQLAAKKKILEKRADASMDGSDEKKALIKQIEQAELDIQDVDLEIVADAAQLRAAQRELLALEASTGSTSSASANEASGKNAPSSPPPPTPRPKPFQKEERPGPVLFRVDETAEGIELVPVKFGTTAQRKFTVYTGPNVEKPGTPGSDPVATASGPITLTPNPATVELEHGATKGEIPFQASVVLADLKIHQVFNAASNLPLDDTKFARKLAGDTGWILEVPGDLVGGTYNVEFLAFPKQGASTEDTKKVTLVIQVTVK